MSGGRRRGRVPVRGALGPLAVAALVLLVSTQPAAAGSLTGYVELTSSSLDETRQEPGSDPSRTKIDSLSQRYSLAFNRRLWPSVTLLMGGLFEQNDSTADFGNGKTDSRLTKLRPYISVRLRTPLYVAEAGYDRNEDRLRQGSSPSVTDVRETYSATLGWTPTDLPSFRAQFFRTNRYDAAREVRDTTDDSLQLSSDYTPAEPLRLFYRGTLETIDDHLFGNVTRSQIHNARVLYTDALFDGRVNVNSDYNLTYRAVKTTTSGEGEVLTRLFPLEGLAAIDDTPEEGVLDLNGALIDGNRTAGAGIDLGAPPVGGDERPRNFGVDFGIEARVNFFFVYVDRELREEIADKFTWEIWTSADNRRWTRRDTLSPGFYDPLERRYQLRLGSILTTRYVKLVVSPLRRDLPFADEYPTILVTELETALAVPAAGAEGSLYTTSHILNLDVRTRLLERHALFYEFNYFLNKSGDAPARYIVSNGVSFNEALDDVFSVSGRVTREDGQERRGDRWAYLYSASLAAVPVPALRHNLIYSGQRESVAGLKSDYNSVFLFSTAALYRGLDTTLGLGRTYTTLESGRKLEGTQVNATATLVPHRSVNLNLIYQDSQEKPVGGSLDSPNAKSSRATEVNLTLTPLTSLYLFGSYRVEDRTGLPKRSVRNYAVSWSPFPYGTLHVNISYNEIYRSDIDSLEKTLTPSLRWRINPRSFLDVAYQKLTTDSIIQKLEREVVTATLRFGF